MFVLRRIKNLAKYELMFLGFLAFCGIIIEMFEEPKETNFQ